MNATEMRTIVRRDLKDEDSGNYRWTDDEIDRAVRRAVAELSRYIPREMTTDIATTEHSREIDISTLSPRMKVEQVEFPIGEHPQSFQRFAVYQDTLTLIGEDEGDGSNARIYWLAPQEIDADSSTIPQHLEDIVALGAAAYAVLSLAQYVTETAGIGGDQADRDFREWGQARLREFKQALKSRARDNRVRQSMLYTGE